MSTDLAFARSETEARVRAAVETTIDDLLATTERLFAERGVVNVALTQIVAESGQKNRSALHYHFGSREGVLGAVMDRRLAPINARRHALLEELPQGASPRAIVRADIAALALTAVEAPWGADYVSILAQLRFHPKLIGEALVSDANLSGIRLARQRLRTAARQIPADLLARRFTWITDCVVFELARWMRATPPARRTTAAVTRLIDDLADFGAAGLLAAP
jgi:AcrR family transcriptional regulator